MGTKKINKDKEGAKSKLNPKQEKFCQLYVSKEHFANGTESYCEAYGIDLSEQPNRYNAVRAEASKLLTNGNILSRINELLDLAGLNDQFIDKQLLFVIMQNADMGSKVSAIREYNKLKQRITDKLEAKLQLAGGFDITLKLDPDKEEK
jgi:hypothetical protein